MGLASLLVTFFYTCYNVDTMAHYEVEIKSLLGDIDKALELQKRMRYLDPDTKLTSKNKQLNHYFEGGSVETLVESVQGFFAVEERDKLSLMLAKGKNFSVRTRQRDDEVLLVLKASVDEGTSSNTISRLEFEEAVPVSLSELDQLVLDSGFRYQAKWSREREEYLCRGFNVCLDRNAGYGYLAEFEKIIENKLFVIKEVRIVTCTKKNKVNRLVFHTMYKKNHQKKMLLPLLPMNY